MNNQHTLATAKDVAQAIRSIGIEPPNSVAIAAISRHCREEFLAHVSACLAGQDNEGTHHKAIEGIVRAVSDDTCDVLRSLGYVATYDKLVKVGRDKPQRFLSAVAVATDPNHANNAAARAFLDSTMSVEDTSEPVAIAPAVATIVPTPAVPATSDTVRPAVASQAAQVVAASQATTFRSHHCYGGAYALTFNAGEWNGRPGIMVDAAVATAPNNYDWQGAIHLWLSAKEIAAALAVFHRNTPLAEFANHGAQKDKSFFLERQNTEFYCKVTARKAVSHPTRAVKIPRIEAHEVAILMMEQLIKAYPNVPHAEVLRMARAIHQTNPPNMAAA